MKYSKGEPTVRNRASIIHFDLQLRYLKQDQLNDLFPFLVGKGYSFSFDMQRGDSIELDLFCVEIEDVSWASNGTELFTFLEKMDYNFGDEE